MKRALERLESLQTDVDTVACSPEVGRIAARLLALHPLHSTDALQLAAALVCTEEEPAMESFVALDERLRDAAQREGFTVLPHPAPSSTTR